MRLLRNTGLSRRAISLLCRAVRRGEPIRAIDLSPGETARQVARRLDPMPLRVANHRVARTYRPRWAEAFQARFPDPDRASGLGVVRIED